MTRTQHFLRGGKHFNRRFIVSRARTLLGHPLFLFLTVTGNGFIVAGAAVFYWLEQDSNPKLQHFIDALWWSMQTVTTVGYGDISPVSIAGKIVGMVLMIFGTALFSAFTGLFAAVLLAPELGEMEREVHRLEKTVHDADKK